MSVLETTDTAAGPVLFRRDGAAARIILNRPAQRNALSLEVMEEVTATLERTGRDPEVRAIVVEAAGPAFCAGHDLGEMVGRDLAFYQHVFDVCTRMMDAIHDVPQPVIARVQGMATAAGCQLVAACDLAVAADTSTFATPGVRIGLFCSTPMVPLTRAIGRKRALQMLLTGEPVDAPTALAWGLVNQVVPVAELDRAVDTLLGQILRFSPRVIGLGKRAFYDQIERAEPDAYEHVRPVMAANAADADAQEGIAAFLEKRPPQWPAR
jgi:enoyl-CoA hydratase/carnithine racemase